MNEIKLESHRTGGRDLSRFLLLVWALNTPFLIATFMVELGIQSTLLQILRLTVENNAGAWWSGMQLLLFGLICLSSSGELAEKRAELKLPMILLGLIGLGLSADEMGSIHERVAILGEKHFGSGKLALLPFAIIGVGAAGYSILALYGARASAGNAWLCVCIGFGLFGLVWVQEHIEHAVSWNRPDARAWRAAIEEGTELLGFSALLSGGILARCRLGPPRSVTSALLPNRFGARVAALLLLVAIVPAILFRIPYSRADLILPRSGDYGITIPVQLFAIAALIAVRLSRMCRKGRNAWLIAGMVLAGSSLATLSSYPHPFTLPAALGGRTIAWHADLDMFVAVPLLAIAGFLAPGVDRIRLAVFVVAVQLSLTALVLSRKEWADLTAPYLVSVPVVIYLTRRLRAETTEDCAAHGEIA